jgi:hypothetical protein
MICPKVKRITRDACHDKRDRGSTVPSAGKYKPILSTGPPLTFARWNFLPWHAVIGHRAGAIKHFAAARYPHRP